MINRELLPYLPRLLPPQEETTAVTLRPGLANLLRAQHAGPAQPFGPVSVMSAQVAPRDLSLTASGTGETLLVVLAVGAAALAGAYAAGIGPFKRTRARRARR